MIASGGMGLDRRRRGGMGDIDVSSWFVSAATINAEVESFNGRLEAWYGDFQSTQADYCAPSFIELVDDYVSRWRSFTGEWFLLYTNKVNKLLALEAEFTKIVNQANQIAAQHGGSQNAIGPATVQSQGQTYNAGEQPHDEDILTRLTTLAKWGSILVGVGVAAKVSSDLGLFKKLGGVLPGGK